MTLTSDVVAYLVLSSKEKSLFLGITGDKKQNSQLKREEIGKTYEVAEINLGINEFKLTIKSGDLGPEAYITCDSLPTKDLYRVLNFKEDTAVSLLCKAQNDKGVFSDTMEAIFGDTKVSFISQNMDGYMDAFNEMVRKYHVSTKKKTTKWVPGHRYDTEDKTYFYLGTYLSKKSCEVDSYFNKDLSGLTPVNLYVESLGNEKKISEVFANNIYGENGIKILWEDSLPKCVDSGEALEDDKPSLYSLYPTILDKAIESGNLKSIFDTLSVQSVLDKIDYSEEVKTRIEAVLKSMIQDTIYDYWNLNNILSPKLSDQTNIDKISKICITNICDVNILSSQYYLELFSFLGIPFESLIEEALKGWNEDELSKDFETYHKNLAYFAARFPEKFMDQSVSSKDREISKVCGKVLGPIVKEKIETAITNYGVGVSEFKYVAVKRSEKLISCVVSVDDILETHGTEDIKNTILKEKFTGAKIYFNLDNGVK